MKTKGTTERCSFDEALRMLKKVSIGADSPLFSMASPLPLSFTDSCSRDDLNFKSRYNYQP